ncbi:maleate isomerase [Bradyrhizobium sp. USDA 4011]
MTATAVKSRNITSSYRTDDGFGTRASIGYVIISGDQTLPAELHMIHHAIPGVAVYESRQPSERVGEQRATADHFIQREGSIATAAAMINSVRPPDVVAYGCTAGAMVSGHARIAEAIRTVLPSAQVTDPLKAALAALAALKCESVALVSPYPQAVSDMMVAHLDAAGYEVPVACRFHNDGGDAILDVQFITPESIERAVMDAGSMPQVQAVFVSCTGMRALEILGRAEVKLGKPVISSNQALCWHALRLAGCHDKITGFGSLFLKV